ncbi:MAG TPA: helicase C-terminal domain-containing protein [Longimicrobiales bacterium]|nr:helicase C-terminal domain-containing protein [Longimicrobiales bacterium]
MTPDLKLEPRSAARIRAEINHAGGNEVCFVAAVATDGVISDPRVLARGNQGAVLAATRDAAPGSLVIHNHPSGDLTPSDADMRVAAELYSNGLGLAIVDNAAATLYVVVAPPRLTELELLDEDEIAALLAPDGPVARAHAGYEDRPTQRDLARVVARAYNDGGIALAEAGTGTGKSVAYLIPAIEWAVRNRERTVISTNTINLQEQLVNKDLPFLRRALARPFRYALVKGRSNYVSIRRALLARAAGDTLFDDGQKRDLEAIVSWLDTTKDGSLQDLAFDPSPEVWDEVASESDVCLRARCPHFEQCFYQKARREAVAAEILVVNHHLLFSDIAVRRLQSNFGGTAVLPPYRRVVLDEAHNVEDAATSHLGVRVTRRGLHRLLARLERRGGRGVLPLLELRLRTRAEDLLQQDALRVVSESLRPDTERARELTSELFARLDATLDTTNDGVLRLREDFAGDATWAESVAPVLDDLLIVLDAIGRGIGRVRAIVETDQKWAESLAELLIETAGLQNRIDMSAAALRTALVPAQEPIPLVRWLERRGREEGSRMRNISASAAPIDLADLMRDALFDRVHTTVLTSATLTTRDGFQFLRGRLGIESGVRATESVHPSPFDFERQTILAVPTDAPDVRAHPQRYGAAIAGITEDHARLTDGGLFVLFTSYSALRAVAAELHRRGAASRWPLFVQGEAPRASLLQRFTDAHRGILLGVASFWEGVDVPGDPLRGLIITKLPFKVPSEPLTAARIEAIDSNGGNSFQDYMLPHAALRLKQGFGRLVRTRTDHGAIVILDPRLLSKGYGRFFLSSLPPAPLVTGPWADVREQLRSFYADADGRRPVGLTAAPESVRMAMDA